MFLKSNEYDLRNTVLYYQQVYSYNKLYNVINDFNTKCVCFVHNVSTNVLCIINHIVDIICAQNLYLRIWCCALETGFCASNNALSCTTCAVFVWFTSKYIIF